MNFKTLIPILMTIVFVCAFIMAAIASSRQYKALERENNALRFENHLLRMQVCDGSPRTPAFK